MWIAIAQSSAVGVDDTARRGRCSCGLRLAAPASWHGHVRLDAHEASPIARARRAPRRLLHGPGAHAVLLAGDGAEQAAHVRRATAQGQARRAGYERRQRLRTPR